MTRPQTQPAGRTTRRSSLLLASVLVGFMLIPGCGGYSGASHRTYEYANALYTICNRQHTAKLDEAAAKIAADTASGELPASFRRARRNGSRRSWTMPVAVSGSGA